MKPTPSPAVSLIRLIFLVLVCQAPALYLIWDQGNDVEGVTRDTNRVVGFIDEQTDPDRQAARQAEQAALLDGILFRIDCNDAGRLQLVVDGLVEQGVITPIDIQSNCGTEETP